MFLVLIVFMLSNRLDIIAEVVQVATSTRTPEEETGPVIEEEDQIASCVSMVLHRLELVYLDSGQFIDLVTRSVEVIYLNKSLYYCIVHLITWVQMISPIDLLTSSVHLINTQSNKQAIYK